MESGPRQYQITRRQLTTMLIVAASMLFTGFVVGKAVLREQDKQDRLDTQQWMRRMEKQLEEGQREMDKLKKQLEDELKRREQRPHEDHAEDKSNGK